MPNSCCQTPITRYILVRDLLQPINRYCNYNESAAVALGATSGSLRPELGAIRGVQRLRACLFQLTGGHQARVTPPRTTTPYTPNPTSSFVPTPSGLGRPSGDLSVLGSPSFYIQRLFSAPGVLFEAPALRINRAHYRARWKVLPGQSAVLCAAVWENVFI